MGFSNVIKRAIKFMADMVYPPNLYCICCGDAIPKSRANGLCDECLKNMPWALQNPFQGSGAHFYFDDVWPCVRYDSYARQIVFAFKKDKKRYIARNMGRLMGERLGFALQDLEAAGKTLPLYMVAVPMYKEKERQRGFNQAQLLCQYAARGSGLQVLAGALVKTQSTAEMKGLSGVDRRLAQGKAFSVPAAAARLISGAGIVLVDDVITTGSTADAAARALKQAGASAVYILAFSSSNFSENTSSMV